MKHLIPATARALNATYTPTQFYTTDEKAKFVKHFINFFDNGCKRSLFTKFFYNHLHLHFMGHIAHFDIDGFYGTHFDNPDKQYEFLSHASEARIYGDPEWTFSDAEEVLQIWINESGILDEYEQKQSDYLDEANTANIMSSYNRLSTAKKMQVHDILSGF